MELEALHARRGGKKEGKEKRKKERERRESPE